MIREQVRRLSRPWLQCQNCSHRISCFSPATQCLPSPTLESGRNPTSHGFARLGTGTQALRKSPSRQCKRAPKSRGACDRLRASLISRVPAKRQAPATDPMGTACCRLLKTRQSLLWTYGNWTLRPRMPRKWPQRSEKSNDFVKSEANYLNSHASPNRRVAPKQTRLPSSLVNWCDSVLMVPSDAPHRARPTQSIPALRSDDIVFASSEPQSEHLRGVVGHNQIHHERAEFGCALDMEGRGNRHSSFVKVNST